MANEPDNTMCDTVSDKDLDRIEAADRRLRNPSFFLLGRAATISLVVFAFGIMFTVSVIAGVIWSSVVIIAAAAFAVFHIYAESKKCYEAGVRSALSEIRSLMCDLDAEADSATTCCDAALRGHS